MSLLENLRALVGAAESLEAQRRAVLDEIKQIHEQPASLDPAEIARKRNHLEAAEKRLADQDEAIRNAEAARAETARKAEQEAAAAERAAIEKEARANEVLVREIARDAEKLAAKIAKLEEHRERARTAGIEDAEVRVRRGPRRTIPPVKETVTAWFDGYGKRYGSNVTHDANGRVVEAKDRVQRTVQDTIREAYEEPGKMPERFADAIKLVRLDGRKL